MSRFLLVAVVALAACRDAGPDDGLGNASRDLDRVEAVEATDRQQMAALSKSAEALRLEAGQIVAEFATADDAFETATAAYQHAQTIGTQAVAEFDAAREMYEQAADRYRTTSMIVILAAASEGLGESLCGQTMSTQKYRAQLRAEGRSLDGLDVDHVWPRAWGGADHPLNYQLLESRVNESLGADVTAKFATWPLKTLQGLTVSALVALRCG